MSGGPARAGTAAGGEGEVIERYFARCTRASDGVVRGIGDDAAVLDPGAGQQLAACCDTLVERVHFPEDMPPEALGHRALAVNLSDLAAMGACPAWALLALTLPAPQGAWLGGFAHGFGLLADRYSVALVGGDTTRGPLAVTVHAMGRVGPSGGISRGGARSGDGVYVTGTLGDAALGLRCWQDRLEALSGDEALVAARFLRPEPRVEAGRLLPGAASSAIDVSDGLVRDLSRVLEASGAGATLELDAVPRSDPFLRLGGRLDDALYGGDDYELCFTLPPGRESVLQGLPEGLAVTRIGTVDAAPGLRGRSSDGTVAEIGPGGYDHFAPASAPPSRR